MWYCKPLWSKNFIADTYRSDVESYCYRFSSILAICSKNTFILNDILSFIAYKIWNYKTKCRIVNENVTNVRLLYFLKNAIAQFYLITKLAKVIECDLNIINELSENAFLINTEEALSTKIWLPLNYSPRECFLLHFHQKT